MTIRISGGWCLGQCSNLNQIFGSLKHLPSEQQLHQHLYIIFKLLEGLYAQAYNVEHSLLECVCHIRSVLNSSIVLWRHFNVVSNICNMIFMIFSTSVYGMLMLRKYLKMLLMLVVMVESIMIKLWLYCKALVMMVWSVAGPWSPELSFLLQW